MHRREARGVLLGGKLVDAWRNLSQAVAGPLEALVDIGLAAEEAQGDLPNVEAAKGLEGQDQLRLRRDRVIAADEQHPEQVVLHLTGQKGLRTVLRSSHVFGPVLVQDATATGSLAQLSHEIVVRHSKEPGRRIVGQASHGPRLERGHQR